ncbi:15580_t:CDS:2, partial [Funneliformis mosseae]
MGVVNNQIHTPKERASPTSFTKRRRVARTRASPSGNDSNECRARAGPQTMCKTPRFVELEPRSTTIRSRSCEKSKEVASFWNLIIEREKHRAIEEHDFMLLQQVKKKYLADVARMQQENDKGIDKRLGIREKLKDTDEEPHVIDRPSEISENSSEMTVHDEYSITLEQSILPENIKDDCNVGNTSNILKRKLNEDNVDEELLENAILLFNESNEGSIIEKIDENLLMDEIRLPDINDRTTEKISRKNTKNPQDLNPCVLGVLDLTKESLKNSGIQNEDIEKLSRDFSNKIGWNIEVIIPIEVQKYFDNNCENIDKNEAVKRLDINIQYMYERQDVETPKGMGEIQAIPTSKARNETKDPFSRTKIGHKVDMKGILVKTPNKFEIIYGEVSGGLGPFGLPASCKKKQYVDKVKLMIMLRDSLNQFFINKRHVNDEYRKKLTVYGWLQI